MKKAGEQEHKERKQKDKKKTKKFDINVIFKV